MSYAPILVSVYNRVSHFKTCIASLQNNPEAIDSDLFIVSDGASRECDVHAIREIRDFVSRISGFKNVTLIARELNMGFFDSITHAHDKILNEYESIIFLEDDVEVSKGFLKFLNNGLNNFKTNHEVYSISAYCPISASSEQYFGHVLSAAFHCPWGYATWSDRQRSINIRKNNYRQLIKNRYLRNYLAKNGPLMLEVLRKDYFENIAAADVRISCQMMLKGMCSVYPAVSLTRNNGFDGSGERMGINTEMSIQSICDDYKVVSWELVHNEQFRSKIVRHGTMIRFSAILRLLYYLNLRDTFDPVISIARHLIKTGFKKTL